MQIFSEALSNHQKISNTPVILKYDFIILHKCVHR